MGNAYMMEYIISFFSKEKYSLANSFYKASIVGNSEKALNHLRRLLSFFVYQDSFLLHKDDDLIACLENCDIEFIKLRKALEDLRGVNIDIIENIDPLEKTLISY